jgi:hypothetical protein
MRYKQSASLNRLSYIIGQPGSFVADKEIFVILDSESRPCMNAIYAMVRFQLATDLNHIENKNTGLFGAGAGACLFLKKRWSNIERI